MGNEQEEELPVPEEDEELVDLKYIHWGYLNCCQTLHKGRKAKNEVWNTYWVTLCGTTLRFYIDSALHFDTVLHPPPPSSFGPLPENEQKVAFFELDGAAVEMLDDGRVFRRRMRKSIYSKVYRRHLFRVKLHKINSYYAFQAPSQSALFTWLSKLQESIDAIENHQISFLAEERLELAQFLMEKKLRKDIETRRVSELIETEEESYEIFDMEDVKAVEKEEVLNPRLKDLKLQLKEKEEFLWQIETQIIDFLGNKGEFQRKEFKCRTTQDYYLVPGRMGTFIPAGTNVTIFGQLPNKRWRCLIEMNELINKMNELVKDLESSSIDPNSEEQNHQTVKGMASRIALGIDLETARNNVPDYPLFGSLPTSVLELNKNSNTDIRASATPIPDDDLIDDVIPENQEHLDKVTLSPYSAHKRDVRTTPVKPVILDDLEITDLDQLDQSDHISGSFGTQPDPGRPRDATSITRESNFEEFPAEAIESDPESEENTEVVDGETNDVTKTTSPSFLRGKAGAGFLISKKLRQKGISIIVGSSSSDEEDEAEDQNNNDRGFTNAVYRKFSSNSTSNKENGESNSYIRTLNRKDLKQSASLGNVNREFSTRTDLLKSFGQQSIHLKHDKELAKTVLELFETKKGPDVKPPRNERRTLKLHKTDKEGFGFWLQTYGFTKNGSGIQKRTFVRYVEDEGPAYMAGLREGDVIVEVNEQHVDDMEHPKIVEMIKEAKSELRLVVKFTDAVRRVELAVRLKKRQAKLKAKQEELEKLKRQEYNILNGLQQFSVDDSSSESTASLQESIHASTESEISSISSVSDEVIVRTSKFAKRSSHVLDSIKELNCNESTYNMPETNHRVSNTTEDELLNFYCDRSDFTTSLPRVGRHGCSLKRVESMPVQKYRSLPRKKGTIYLDGSFAREYAIDYSNTGHLSTADSYLSNDSFDYGPSDEDSSDEGSSRNSYTDQSSQENVRIPRRSNRPKSYKMAMNSKTRLEEHGEINKV